MEEQNEILAVVREGFARVDRQFARVDEHFQTLRRQFADQLDGVSDGLHVELRAQSKKLLERIETVHVTIEKVDSKLGLVGENVANVMKEIGHYHATVQTPLETRVTNLEGRVWVVEPKK